jgi:acyl-ACP thioesterase
MEPKTAVRPLTRGEQETETEATRLIELIEGALALVVIRSSSDVDSLDAFADRIERAARDLSVALRELAHERRITQNAAE